jgi:hypothetical protein
LMGRHGAMKPAGRVRCNMAPIAKAYTSGVSRMDLVTSPEWSNDKAPPGNLAERPLR